MANKWRATVRQSSNESHKVDRKKLNCCIVDTDIWIWTPVDSSVDSHSHCNKGHTDDTCRHIIITCTFKSVIRTWYNYYTKSDYTQPEFPYLRNVVNCRGVRLRNKMTGNMGRKAMHMSTPQLRSGEHSETWPVANRASEMISYSYIIIVSCYGKTVYL